MSTRAPFKRCAPAASRSHPRTLTWFSTSCFSLGGASQGLVLLGVLVAGQGRTAAIPLLLAGVVLAIGALPGWTELVLMYPNRVGGIAASCAEAFRPVSPILANLAGVCYWFGWVSMGAVAAGALASVLHQAWLPSVPVTALAAVFVLIPAGVSLLSIRSVTRLATPIAAASAILAFLSAIVPAFRGDVDWHTALHFQITVPFPGVFGKLTGLMAGLFVVGFAAPAFERAACHAGETLDPNRSLPRALASGGAAALLYLILLPLVWLGALGPDSLGRSLATALGPTFAPLVGGAAKATAVWFVAMSLFLAVISPFTGASRTLSQLSEDGLLPELLSLRWKNDVPWTATILTAISCLLFVLVGGPLWLVAGSNLAYLIGIATPSVAVWLLRRGRPEMERPFRAPRGTIALGVLSACVWGASILLGFQQYGLTTMIAGFCMALSGALAYGWRIYRDRRKSGLPGVSNSLHLKLTGAMLAVLALDAAGNLIAVNSALRSSPVLTSIAEDIFVAVVMVTVYAGLVLPGIVSHSVTQVSKAADRLVSGTLADFARAMRALGDGEFDEAKARFKPVPIALNSEDEIGEMARSFNMLQEGIGRAADGLEGARKGLQRARADLTETNERLRAELYERRCAQEALRNLLEEKDSLMKEVHHRVKNNMQVVSSLLNLQLDYLPDNQARPIITETQGRIAAMALVHEKLYQSVDLARVDFGDYLRDLTDNIVCTFAPIARAIEFNLDVENLYLGIDTAIPCGLIVNELVSNAYKHAFPNGRSGALSVSLRRSEDGRLKLHVSDDGCGLRPGIDIRRTESLGMQLVLTLVEQLQGTLEVASAPGEGTRFSLDLHEYLVTRKEYAAL